MSTRRFRQWGVLLPVALGLAIAFIYFGRTFMAPSGSASLTWTRPVASESNLPMQNIAGYTVHCWGEGGRHTHTIRIDDPAVTHYEIDGLPPGRYQCAVSAFTDDGFESALSNFVARTVK